MLKRTAARVSGLWAQAATNVVAKAEAKGWFVEARAQAES